MEHSQGTKFAAAMKGIKIPSHLRREFEKANIEKISLNEHKRQLSVFLSSAEIIEEKYIIGLKRVFLEEFEGLSEVSLQISFNCSFEKDKLFRSYWPEILHYMENLSPACRFLLRDSAVEVKDGGVKLNLANKGSYILKDKGADKLITTLMRDRFGENYIVEFNDTKDLNSNDTNKKEVEAVKAHIAENNVTASPNNTTAQPKKSEFSNKPRRRKSGGVKLASYELIVDTKLSEELFNNDSVIIGGVVFELGERETKKGNLIISFDITDGHDSITCKFFSDKESYAGIKKVLAPGEAIAVKGVVQYDDYIKETIIMVNEISKIEIDKKCRMDEASTKRIELHLHTQMSDMDATNTATDYIKQAAKWGHKAIAITDHGVIQSFPEAMEASKKYGVKIIYGVEAYLVDDLGAVCRFVRNQNTNGCFTVFDIETTGLNKDIDSIIEIGAVKISNYQVIDTFQRLVDPKRVLPDKIMKLTGITDEMLQGKPEIGDVLKEFLDFAGDSVLVAHNAAFDVGFISTWASRLYGIHISNTQLDTVELSRMLYPKLQSHKLSTVCEHLGISLINHHRAVDDAAATGELLLKSFENLSEQNILSLSGINVLASKSIDKSKLKSRHAVILVKNYTGLRNLYELISKSHMNYFYRRPRIPKSEYISHSDGLIIGTACEGGELYKALLDKSPPEYVEELAHFYDYFEIQPLDNNMFLVRGEHVDSREVLIEINKQIVALGERYSKPVVATCDAHFLNPEDEVYRRVIMYGDGFKDADNQAPLYYRTTEEMLQEFNYLGKDVSYKVVVENTNIIADMVEEIKPIPDETFPPIIEGADEELTEIAMSKAKELYGENLPAVVSERLDRELGSIIKNGFSVMYIIAQKLVWKSVADGYLVGSRGSVGSSFAATMSGITEVNPLPPHYICPCCKYSEFDSEDVTNYKNAKPGGSGCDMPDKTCPVCKTMLLKDGHDIPFETFLGFDGDKEPDIDLNFSGEYQSRAHDYAEELFGKGYIYKAGTISTIADKTAYGYVKNYMDEHGVNARGAEINRIKKGLTGIKRTTGQHPGGLMVVPSGHSIYEFCPVQRPANDAKSTVVTTHFDYHSISGRLLKLDLLGHDVPTIIRYLHDNTGIDPATVDLGGKETLSLFTSCRALGISSDEAEFTTGTLGLPEFGTSFVRQMLLDTMPSSFSELARISGLSHGTDVWLGNAQELVRNGICTLEEVIPTRDDIMVYLISKGLPRLTSFKIMEDVRKGKGLKDEYVDIMKETSIPDWYIDSCNRIKYMFPKGHAVAYVMMTVRIGYFKIHHPYSFYGATFSVKYDDFDYEIMCRGKDIVKDEIKRIRAQGNDAPAKEKSTLATLELVYEMYSRGLKFVPLDMYKANATKFIVTDDGLMPPLCSIQGLGETVAQNIIEARSAGEFITIEDFRLRTKATKTVIELLKKNGVLKGLPETSQLSLF